MSPARISAIGDEGGVSLDEQLSAVAACGLAGIELRSIAGRALNELTFGDALRAAAKIHEAGLQVPVVDTSIGSWTTNITADFAWELRTLRTFAQIARLFDCSQLRVMSYPNAGLSPARWRNESLRRMDRLATVAEDFGVSLLHENCCGWAASDAERTVEMLEHVGSDCLRLLFDTGNGLEYGYSAREYLEATLPWVAHVHVKDGRRCPSGVVDWMAPGSGDAGVSACIDVLEAAGYEGWYSLEPHLVHVPHNNRERDSAITFEHAEVRAAALERCAAALEQCGIVTQGLA